MKQVTSVIIKIAAGRLIDENLASFDQMTHSIEHDEKLLNGMNALNDPFAGMCIKTQLSNYSVDHVLCGMRTIQQVDDCISLIKMDGPRELSFDEISELTSMISRGH